jgi:hypothetical protein
VLAISRDLRDMFCTGAACLLIDATVIIGCGLLMVLFVPLLAGLNALLNALDGDVGWRFPAVARGRLKLGHLSPGGARGGDIAPSFDGASGGIGRHMERSRPCSAICTTLGRSCDRPLGVKVMSAAVKLVGRIRPMMEEPSW